MSLDLEQMARSAFGPARELEPSEGEVARALSRFEATRPRRSTRVAGAGAALVALAIAAVMVVPASRGAIAGAIDSFADFFAGGEAPGPPVPDSGSLDLLNWLGTAQPGSARVIARTGDERLVAYRDRDSGAPCFSYGRHTAECGGTTEFWESRFANDAVAPLAITRTDAPRRVALWGITAADVARVEVRYRDGGEVGGPAINGFVLIVDPARGPRELVARRADGQLLGVQPVADMQWDIAAPGG